MLEHVGKVILTLARAARTVASIWQVCQKRKRREAAFSKIPWHTHRLYGA
jgi:hypothetical protein